ncbi:MAG: type VI secretion protein IcmF/TssM N-terminal domain-containing protein [Gemmataceae bacterium]
MIGLLKRLWAGMRKIGKFLLPIGKQVGKRANPILVWTLHILAVVLGLLLLYWLNGVFKVPPLVDTRLPILRNTWLPILGLLLYLLGWNVYWLLATPSESTRQFPEIDNAWEEARQALTHANIDPTSRPLYLVLGHPEAAEVHLFEAARLEWNVPQTPKQPAAWLHVYANRDSNPDNEGIYVTCSEVSLMGKLATRLMLKDLGSTQQEQQEAQVSVTDATLEPGADAQQILRTLRQAPEGRGHERANTALWRRSVRPESAVIPDIRNDETVVAEYTARLEYLCERITEDRAPFCGINGILVLLPLGASDSKACAAQTADLCHRDLQTIRRVVGVRCPVYVLQTDLETTWGFFEFVQQTPKEARSSRVGRSFPLDTDLDPDSAGKAIVESLEWMCLHEMRDLVYKKHLKVESSLEHDPRNETRRNVRLYRFLTMLTQRRQHLAQIVKNALITKLVPGTNSTSESWFYGGFYLAATGEDRDTEQAFVRGVLSKLNEQQMYVCWTHETIVQDQRDNAQATVGFVILGILWGVVIGYFVWRFWLNT